MTSVMTLQVDHLYNLSWDYFDFSGISDPGMKAEDSIAIQIPALFFPTEIQNSMVTYFTILQISKSTTAWTCHPKKVQS